MLCFLKIAYPSFSDSIPFYLLKHCQLLTCSNFPCGGFITLLPLTFSSIKARDVTLSTVVENWHFGFGSGKDNVLLFDLFLYVHSTIFQLCGTVLPGFNQY